MQATAERRWATSVVFVAPVVNSLRWVAIAVFVLSSVINYLDRELLSAIAPGLKAEFHLSNLQYGEILSVAALCYALSAPFTGWLIDRVGLTLGYGLCLGLWSLAGTFTGLTSSFRGLLTTRSVLGVGEGSSMPALGKANATYLKPNEMLFSIGLNRLMLTAGSVIAPLLAAAMAPRYGWRSLFVLTGLLGLLWIPAWVITSRRIPPTQAAPVPKASVSEVLRDPRMWGLTLGNVFIMALYTVWTSWTTIYFVSTWHLTQADANRHYVWIPPIFGTAGAFAASALVMWMSRRGRDVIGARLRFCWIGSILMLSNMFIPQLRSPLLAVMAISFSTFWLAGLQANIHVMPVDLLGRERAAFGVSLLACSFGLMQTLVSPLIGATLDRFGFTAVCLSLACTPLIGIAIVQWTVRRAPSYLAAAEVAL